MLSSDSCPRYKVWRLVASVCPRPLGSFKRNTFTAEGLGFTNNVPSQGIYIYSIMQIAAEIKKGWHDGIHCTSVRCVEASILTTKVLNSAVTAKVQWKGHSPKHMHELGGSNARLKPDET